MLILIDDPSLGDRANGAGDEADVVAAQRPVEVAVSDGTLPEVPAVGGDLLDQVGMSLQDLADVRRAALDRCVVGLGPGAIDRATLPGRGRLKIPLDAQLTVAPSSAEPGPLCRIEFRDDLRVDPAGLTLETTTSRATSAIVETTWTDVDPVPTTATRLPRRSRSSGHSEVWKHGPRNRSSPGQSGRRGSFRIPTALITCSKTSGSPLTVSVQAPASSSHTILSTWAPYRMRSPIPSVSTASAMYWRSSAAPACDRDQS